MRAFVAALVVLVIAAGPLAAAQPAAAADQAELVIKWTGDNSSAMRYQPSRAPSSPHYADFDDVQVSVSQTTGLIDQAVRVGVSGFAGTVTSAEFGQNAQNFFQAMQCWGVDPAAANFRETCQWGGRGDPNSNNTGIGNSVYFDNALRVAPRDNNPFSPTTFDVPFRTFDGAPISGKTSLFDPDGAGPRRDELRYPLLELFGPSTTNEVLSASIGSDGTGYFDFEVQTNDQAPQLGCGREGHLRCWLVLVPRGTVFGGEGSQCSNLLDPAVNSVAYDLHHKPAIQGGSPINPKCDYWDNRMVVPLDFNEVGSSCELGSAEQRVIGSQLMVNAMSSWQPALCSSLRTTFSFSTNPDVVARAQLLEGLAPMAFTGLPLSPGEFETAEERQLLADSKLVYAPAAISGVSVAFIAQFGTGRQESLNISARLMAKLLTQSYRFLVPTSSADPDKNVAHLPTQNLKYRFIWQDPEFVALNPDNAYSFTSNPVIILPGPAGADAIRQVWRWIAADSDAVSFLNGEPDPSGMTINPYYLPSGHPNAAVPTFTELGEYATDATGAVIRRTVGLSKLDGSPDPLATAGLDIFPKADESKVPIKLGVERTRFDTLQFAPYTDSLLSGARATFRGNSGSRTVWDPVRLNAAGEVGDWVSAGVASSGQRFIITITDTPSAQRYGLSSAALVGSNRSTPVSASETTMGAALTALAPTALDSVKQVNPALVPADAYPLTFVTYAAVNLTTSTATSRTTIANMLQQVLSTGQVRGSGIGQLPAGYLPLTSGLKSEADAALAAITSFVAPTKSTSTSTSTSYGIAQDTYDPGNIAGSSVDGTNPEVTGGADSLSDARTPVSATSPIASSALVIALIIGAAGVLIGPLLFRGLRRP